MICYSKHPERVTSKVTLNGRVTAVTYNGDQLFIAITDKDGVKHHLQFSEGETREIGKCEMWKWL